MPKLFCWLQNNKMVSSQHWGLHTLGFLAWNEYLKIVFGVRKVEKSSNVIKCVHVFFFLFWIDTTTVGWDPFVAAAQTAL
jgi:hypothetical protein